MAWGKKIYLGLDLNDEPMERIDVDDQPTPVVEHPQAREYAQLLSNAVFFSVFVVDVTNTQSFYG